jgi:hypothetical protein
MVALALLLGVAVAADEGTKATVKKVNAENNTIVVNVGGDAKTYEVAKEAEIYTQGKGKKNKPGPKDPVSGGLSGVKADSDITFTTISKNGKDIIVSIKIEGMKKK